jgi:SAM-dependent methyltransferase
MTSAGHEHNRRAWDARVRGGARFTRPAVDGDFHNPLSGQDPRGWLQGDVRGKRVLCLAAGGGKQGPLFAAAGAIVTVVDVSGEMLALDREVAAEREVDLRTVQTSMDDLAMFQPGEFDCVVQPVSTCYVPDVRAVYREVARVTAAGGLYISQHKQPASLQAGTEASPHYQLTEPYYRSGPLPEVAGSLHREEGTLEFLHRWEDLVGGLCQSGFQIEDLVEPLHADRRAAPGSFKHRSLYLAPYVRIKARRIGKSSEESVAGKLWLPAADV